MDPATIIGTTSAILSFVQFSGKIISTAVQIHRSVTGATEDNRSFAAVVASFHERLESLRKDAATCESKAANAGPGQALNDAEKQLLATIKRCEDLAVKIEVVLKKTAAAARQSDSSVTRSSTLLRKWLRPSKLQDNPPNACKNKGPTLSGSIKAAVQTVWQRDAVEELRRDWESCSIQFDQAIFRLETRNSLEILHGVLEHHSADLADIRGLVSSLVQTSDRVVHLQAFIQEVEQADSLSSRRRRNHEKILDSLKFTGINSRRDRVAEAAANTFAWLIEGESIPQELSPGLEISLKQWLRAGSGIFHITGKPGSGKSTFMKSMEESSVADAQLRRWAVGANTRLVRASCYLWKAAEANPLQNELDGLARTLLFQILQQEPDLTSMIFKNHPSWNPTMFTLVNCVTNSYSTTVTLRSQDILAALESALATSNHRFFLLIDGLDEMKTTAEYEYKDIAERINHWGAQSSGHVKICVSSREYSAFMETFSIRQRMKLHVVTWRDVKALIDLKLEKHGYLTPEERESLAMTIATAAQGVFLWVILALKRLVPLLTAKQGMQRLVREADNLPVEMNDFLMETLRRIPEVYRKEAWAVLTVMSSMYVMSSAGFSYCFDFHRLVHYSMLEKCLDSGWEIPDRDDLMGAEDIIHLGKDFISRFSEFSSGLLELSGHQSVSESAWDIRLYFTHRSVYDFLLEHPDKLPEALAIPGELKKLSAAELILRATIQVVTDISWEELCKDQYASSGPSAILPALCATTLPDGSRVFPLVHILEEVLLRKQGFIKGHQRLNEMQWAELRPSPHMSSAFQIALVTRHQPFKAFIEWAQEKGNYPKWIISDEFKAWTAEKLFHCTCDLGGSGTCRRWSDSLMSAIFSDMAAVDSFREIGWLSYSDFVKTDHSLIPAFSPILRGPFWLHILVALLTYDTDGFCETFVRFHTNMIEDVTDLDIQFEWWFDWHYPGFQSHRIYSYGAEREVSGGEKEDDVAESLPRDDASRETHAMREWLRKWKSTGAFPPGFNFGMTIKMGENEEPQLIQGPQWTDIKDNELLPVFVAIFQKAKGVATFKDILRNWVTEVLTPQRSRDFEKWAFQVREGSKDLATADEELNKELDDNEEIYQWTEESQAEARWLPRNFVGLYRIISLLETPDIPVTRKEASKGPRTHCKPDERLEKPDDHERRRILRGPAVDVLKDNPAALSKNRHDWSTIIILCLGMLLAVFTGFLFQQR